MWWSDSLRCPVCGAKTTKEGKSLLCAGTKRHCFDFASEGYVNLATAKAAGGGDDAALIAARTSFLDGGYYLPFAARITALLQGLVSPNGIVVDAGCGEGYYTCKMASAGFCCYGFDLSKRGVRAAAKRATRQGLTAFFGVAGIYTLPLQDASVDAVVSLFAPIAEGEFLRVLKPGGILIVAGAGREHLHSLKRVLYDVAQENEPRADLPTAMTELSRETLTFQMELDGDAARSLFAMTPYYYRTARAGHERLAACRALSCEAQMDIFLYRKS